MMSLFRSPVALDLGPPSPPSASARAPVLRRIARAATATALCLTLLPAGISAAHAADAAPALSQAFASEVDRRLEVPAAAQRAYAWRLQKALAHDGHADLARQYVVLVDRAPAVQALFLFWRAEKGQPWRLVGASPVSTGMPGQYEHFITPVGVFDHTPDTMDYRAEGTVNDNGIRGYGRKGMRVYDLGWQEAERGWGKPARSKMRFQMHATDPDRLEWLLGERHSKGCVRIPGTLNVFLDKHGVLDAEYESRWREQQAREKAEKAEKDATARQSASSTSAAASGAKPASAAREDVLANVAKARDAGVKKEGDKASQAGAASAASGASAADAASEAGARKPQKITVLRADRTPVDDAGRYIVVIDSQTKKRPSWSPDPKRHGAKYQDAVRNDTAD